MKFTYKPDGVCSQLFEIEVENNIVKDCVIYGGCSGNTQGVAKLILGMNVDDVINKLDGIRCGYKNTSCPDQLAKALKAYQKSNS